MNPHTKHQSLFFTPRTPWGTRLQGRTFQNHMHASENRQPPVGQAGLDQIADRADHARKMDMNGVPRSLQSQISPERAEEITDPSRRSLPAPQIPTKTNQAFPLEPNQQPQPPQTLPRQAGSGVLRPATTVQPMPANALGQAPRTLPGAQYFNGLKVGPVTIGVDGESVGNGGFGLKFTPDVWKIPKKENH